jgi:3-dehydroquinate synthase
VLLEGALSDKKRCGGTVNLIIPKSVGACIIRSTPVKDLKTFIQEGL